MAPLKPTLSAATSPRLLSLFLLFLAFVVLPFLLRLRSAPLAFQPFPALATDRFHIHPTSSPPSPIGSSIMAPMGNATAKAELGRATWKFLHTMTARFPEHPTNEQRQTLKSFIYLFSRLYPCGDCARHFQDLLKLYPPQTSSRTAASLHLCSLHNLVNERLGKDQYNCTSLIENYNCGCGQDEHEERAKKASAAATATATSLLAGAPVF